MLRTSHQSLQRQFNVVLEEFAREVDEPHAVQNDGGRALERDLDIGLYRVRWNLRENFWIGREQRRHREDAVGLVVLRPAGREKHRAVQRRQRDGQAGTGTRALAHFSYRRKMVVRGLRDTDCALRRDTIRAQASLRVFDGGTISMHN